MGSFEQLCLLVEFLTFRLERRLGAFKLVAQILDATLRNKIHLQRNEINRFVSLKLIYLILNDLLQSLVELLSNRFDDVKQIAVLLFGLGEAILQLNDSVHVNRWFIWNVLLLIQAKLFGFFAQRIDFA